MKEILKKYIRFSIYNSSLNHIWLCSWPRSGNTLLRHLLLSGYGYHEYDFPFFCKDIHNTKTFFNKKSINLDNKFFFKSHYSFHSKIKNAILLLRNPVDASLSWSIYKNPSLLLNNNEKKIEEVALFLLDNSIYDSWIKNTCSYIESCPNLHIIKYDLLVNDMFNQLKKINSILNINDRSFDYSVTDQYKHINVAQHKGQASSLISNKNERKIEETNLRRNVKNRLLSNEKIKKYVEFYQCL